MRAKLASSSSLLDTEPISCIPVVVPICFILEEDMMENDKSASRRKERMLNAYSRVQG